MSIAWSTEVQFRALGNGVQRGLDTVWFEGTEFFLSVDTRHQFIDSSGHFYFQAGYVEEKLFTPPTSL